MAYLGIVASPTGLKSARTDGDLSALVASRISRLPNTSPIVILVHGYRYHPGHRATDPHRHIFAFRDARTCNKIRSWPLGLGFTRHADDAGLCIGFGWHAQASHATSLALTGRTGFASVYDQAPFYGTQLARLIDLVHELAPDRRVDIMAHSLGARVSLSALPLVKRAPGRIILLGAAEFGSTARSFLDAIRTPERPEIYNFTARFNDLYDALFETFAPHPERRSKALGQGLDDRPDNWLDLQLDRADVTAWINDRGIPLRPARARFCHWGFYTRGGAFGIYRTILARKPGWDIKTLRTVPCLSTQEPRWSRLWARPGTSHEFADPRFAFGHDFKSA